MMTWHLNRPAASSGFTLIELAVVVAIVAVVSTVAAPSFKVFLDSMNTKSAAMDLVGDLTTARSEALKRNASVSIIPVDNDWANGWQILRGGTQLREHTALRSGITVSAPAAGVSFLPNGRMSDTELNTSNATWAIRSSVAGVQARCVVITPSGAARTKQGSCT